MNSTFKVGIGRQDITPKIGAWLMGYAPARRAESVGDRLNLTAYAFESNGVLAIVATADVCIIDNELCKTIRREISDISGVPYDNIIIDPIEIQQADSAYGVAKNKKNMEKESTGANFLIKIAIPPMIALGIIALLSGEPIALPLFTAPFILWIVVIKLWDIFVAKPLTKRARRVRTKQQAENTGSILKILGRIVQHLFFH